MRCVVSAMSTNEAEAPFFSQKWVCGCGAAARKPSGSSGGGAGMWCVVADAACEERGCSMLRCGERSRGFRTQRTLDAGMGRVVAHAVRECSAL